MTKNVGPNDISLRTAGGVVAALLALFVVDITWLRILLALVAAVLAATAFLGFCPLYRLLGKNTCPVEGAPAQPTTGDTQPVQSQSAEVAEGAASEESR